jgi:hypothetical protein
MVRRLRLKGTNIYVQAIEYRNDFLHDMGGMYCKYLNGDRKGAYQIISGDCLVEENDPNIK